MLSVNLFMNLLIQHGYPNGAFAACNELLKLHDNVDSEFKSSLLKTVEEQISSPGRYAEDLQTLDSLARAINLLRITLCGDGQIHFESLFEHPHLLQVPEGKLGAAILIELARSVKSSASESFDKFLRSILGNSTCTDIASAIHIIAEEHHLQDLAHLARHSAFGAEANYFRVDNNVGLKHLASGDCPKVSVFISTYNHSLYVGKAISSILNQDFDEKIEIIITDDASTDGTRDELLLWKKKYPDLIKLLLFNKNIFSQGRRPFEAFLREARGEYIAICEGDDFWLDPRKLKYQSRCLDCNPQLASVTHNFFIFNSQKLALSEAYKVVGPVIEAPNHIKSGRRLFWLHTLMFRREFEEFPPEHFACVTGDRMLTAYLGHFGRNLHLTDLFGSVQRRNPFSSWMPMGESEKNARRFAGRISVLSLNERLGASQGVLRDCRILAERIPISQDEKESIASTVRTKITQYTKFWPPIEGYTIL